MADRLIFGIDGGGTRSRIALASLSGEVLCRLEGASTNMYASQSEHVVETLRGLIEDACATCGRSVSDISAGCIGSAGLSRPQEREKFSSALLDLLGPDVPVKLCNDAEILLVGGVGDLQGICLVSGTGSIASGRLADGTLVRSGGMGWRLGDEGSAWWIGQQAICRGLRSEEFRDMPTGMMGELLHHFQLNENWELIPLFNNTSLDKAAIASAAPIVTKAALQGDVLALDILHCAAEELYRLVASIVWQLPALSEARLVCAGGVMEYDSVVIEGFRGLLSDGLPAIHWMDAKGTALDGALILAQGALNISE